MLRISINKTSGRSTTLHLEGQVSGEWLSELDEICVRMLAEARAVTIDLGDVTLIDRAGIALLASLADRGVELAHCSPFQDAQLRLAATSLRDTTQPLP